VLATRKFQQPQKSIVARATEIERMTCFMIT
jgi:hypothetical protein